MTTLPEAENFLGIAEEYSSFERSEIAVLSIPYEHTVSYGAGTANGPRAILDASHYVEFWDEEFGRELCFERGIATLSSLDFSAAKDKEALDGIYSSAVGILEKGKFLVSLGGEHTISSALIRAHLERFPNLTVLQFDAHSDLRESYQDNPYSHASVMARTIEFLPPQRLVQVGIRAQCKEEYDLIQREGVRTFFAHELRQSKQLWKQGVLESLSDEVYITFDVDCFDPSIMPTTGTPEPGGLLWDETIELLKLIGSHRRIVGFDVVELAPAAHYPAPAYTAAKLTYKMMNAAFMR